jgi:aminoglycoside 3-N-acetyltransferase I
MSIIITRLTTHDAPKLQRLNKLFGTVFDDADSYHTRPPRAEYLADFLANDHNIVLVAERDGQIVGGLVAYCLSKFEQERKEVYLYDLAVAADHQRQGIGKLLVGKLRAVAKSLGAYLVFVQADEGDDAVAFYESLQPIDNLRTRSFDFKVL